MVGTNYAVLAGCITVIAGACATACGTERVEQQSLSTAPNDPNDTQQTTDQNVTTSVATNTNDVGVDPNTITTDPNVADPNAAPPGPEPAGVLTLLATYQEQKQSSGGDLWGVTVPDASQGWLWLATEMKLSNTTSRQACFNWTQDTFLAVDFHGSSFPLYGLGNGWNHLDCIEAGATIEGWMVFEVPGDWASNDPSVPNPPGYVVFIPGTGTTQTVQVQ